MKKEFPIKKIIPNLLYHQQNIENNMIVIIKERHLQKQSSLQGQELNASISKVAIVSFLTTPTEICISSTLKIYLQ